MIQKFFQYYDDSEYYIEANRKKLASDNMSVIGGMLTFFVCVSLMFILVAIAFGGGVAPYEKYFPAALAVIGATMLHKAITNVISNDFIKVRIYALFVYSVVTISFSVADCIIYPSSRAVFFPSALIVMTMLYMDRIGYILLFKAILTAVFIIIDFRIKGNQVVINDLTVAVLAIIASGFSYMATISNILTRREDSINLVKKSQTDLLTGLLNKVSFEEKCSEYLDRKMNGAKCTMFIFDLDDFKHVNDQFGHAAGDKVIKFFAETLRGYFHPDDIIGRIGGDEFMVLVLGDMSEDFADKRCRSVLHELKTSNIDGITGMTCSMGFVIETKKVTFDEIYKMADEALYQAKENGKAQYQRYQAN